VFGISILGLFLGTAALFTYYAQSPDRELDFVREVPSSLSPTRLDRNISTVARWPQWFFALKKVHMGQSETATTAQGNPLQKVQKGYILTLDIDSKKGLKKKYSLTAQVTQYIPGKRLDMKILDDTSGKLTRLFDHIEWSIELKPKDKGSLIRGEMHARTRHWRSRLFGQIAEKILMNQLFYPDLLKLAELKQPFSVEPAAELMPSSKVF
jgi:hypothetical protein